MARRLSDYRPRTYAKPIELRGLSFMITDAQITASPWREGESVIVIAYKLNNWREGTDVCPPEGTVTMGLKGREYIADAFSQVDADGEPVAGEPFGPCTMVDTPMANGQMFWQIVDLPVEDGETSLGPLFEQEGSSPLTTLTEANEIPS